MPDADHCCFSGCKIVKCPCGVDRCVRETHFCLIPPDEPYAQVALAAAEARLDALTAIRQHTTEDDCNDCALRRSTERDVAMIRWWIAQIRDTSEGTEPPARVALAVAEHRLMETSACTDDWHRKWLVDAEACVFCRLRRATERDIALMKYLIWADAQDEPYAEGLLVPLIVEYGHER